LAYICSMRNRLNLLIASCIVVILTLCSIQFYLVRNTYRLTRSEYRMEVRAALDAARQSPTGQLFEKEAADSLQQAGQLYASGHIDKNNFRGLLKHKLTKLGTATGNWYQHVICDSLHLSGAVYQVAFEMIVLEHNGRMDTLLSKTQPPLIYGGAEKPAGEALLIFSQESRGGEYEQHRIKGNKMASSSLFVRAVTTQHIYLQETQQTVFRRMAGILALAILLICAVVILFYLVFRSLFRQRRMTEIRTDLVNNITHELKTPLSSTAVILESLLTPQANASEPMRNELLAAMQRQQDKLQRIVDSVLDDALTGRDILARVTVPIADLLIGYASEYPAPRHQLKVAVKTEDVLLATNMPALEKVLNNLLDNAVKYTPPGTLIRLEAYRKAAEYFISVEDHGPGIPERYQHHVFEKFFRVPDQNRHNVKGLGLGLAISLQTVKALGGELTLTSADGEGCAFTIRLPL
jgi:two-component system phosphate regulon sensor histidine kinase PhoR